MGELAFSTSPLMENQVKTEISREKRRSFEKDNFSGRAMECCRKCAGDRHYRQSANVLDASLWAKIRSVLSGATDYA
eukprot:6059734-Amphidinium_carterae.1